MHGFSSSTDRKFRARGSKQDGRAMEEEADIGAPWEEPEQPVQSTEDPAQRQIVIKDIANLQDGLRALLSKVDTTTADCKKLTSSNETMSLYIDNLTRNKLLFSGTAK